MRHLPALSLVLLLVACNAVPTGNQTGSSEHVEQSESGSTVNIDRLNDSPRHQEWVEVENNGKTIHTWVVYPKTTDKRPVVLLIHENKGLNDWARGMADQVAEAGYIAVAPDLLSGFSETMTRTSDFPSDDERTKAIGQLNKDNVQSNLAAVALWAESIPASNGKLVSAGFCWGGGQSFTFATRSDDLDAALVFYGTGPTEASEYEDIETPVYGFYGGADARVNATLDASKQNMTAADKDYDYVIYDGAGHAFMRTGEDPAGDPANIAARDAAWERMKEILSSL